MTIDGQVEAATTPDSPTDETTEPTGVGEALAGTPAITLMEQEQPPPLGLPTPEGKPFGIRAGAFIIDTLMINAVTFAGGVAGVFLLAFVLTATGRPLLPASAQQGFTLKGFLVGLALGLVYFGIFEWLYGASPGKLILKLRVVREDGGRPRLWSVLVRGIFRYIDGLFFGIPATLAMDKNPLRQRIGDRYAHTLVVGYRDPLIREQRSWIWFAGAAVLSLITLSTFTTLFAIENLKIAPPRTVVAASNINLRLEDLGGKFTLEAEMDKEAFEAALGKEAFQDAQLTDVSLRQFKTNVMKLQTRVLAFSFMPQDTIGDLIASEKRDLAEKNGNQELIFDPMHEVSLGERASVIRFVRPSTREEGYVLVFIRRNVVTRLLSYGASGAMSEDDLMRLASIVDARIR